MNLTQASKDRFRELAVVVRNNYRLFDMNHWAKTNCKTTGCLAGIALVHFAEEEWDTYEDGLKYFVNLDPYESPDERGSILAGAPQVRPRAESLLGITDNESEKVFFHRYWPLEYGERFDNAKTQRQRALVASDYLTAIADGKVVLTADKWGRAEIVESAH